MLESSLEGGVAVVGRERGVGGGQAGEELLGRAARRPPGACGHEDGVPERAPRELVDRTGVEVVDERVGVTVERVGSSQRSRVCEGGELVADVLVERRAPERVPAPVGRLEMRVHEARRHRALCRAQHLEDDPGAPAEHDPGRRLLDERE